LKFPTSLLAFAQMQELSWPVIDILNCSLLFNPIWYLLFMLATGHNIEGVLSCLKSAN
jgi:hypothetical protein